MEDVARDLPSLAPRSRMNEITIARYKMNSPTRVVVPITENDENLDIAMREVLEEI